MSGYIGTQPVPQATQTRQTFTATAAQTSFATGGYQAGYLDVFLNGVKLVDGTDYTAINGSDVVLTTGAASGDTLEVVAYTAFEAANVTGATDFTVTGSFTSRGIDDNATSTAMTLDTSGNVLVGKTSDSFGTAGAAYRANGSIAATASANEVLDLNRLSSDGNIMRFFKDGTTVGSIGSAYGVISYINLDPRSGGTGVGATNTDSVIPVTGTGVSADGTKDLGISSARWRDLYLSGGVYLGGTGSANKLDDYETGTFTPTLTGDVTAPTLGYVRRDGYYTKVGNIVHCNIYLQTSSRTGGSGSLRILGLPFVSTNVSSIEFYGTVLGYAISSGRTQLDCNTFPNTSQLAILGGADNTSWATVPITGWGTGTTAMRISITYRAS